MMEIAPFGPFSDRDVGKTGRHEGAGGEGGDEAFRLAVKPTKCSLLEIAMN